MPVACRACGARFCSSSCADAAAKRGGSHWDPACAARAAFRAGGGRADGPVDDTLGELLIDILAKRAGERQPPPGGWSVRLPNRL